MISLSGLISIPSKLIILIFVTKFNEKKSCSIVSIDKEDKSLATYINHTVLRYYRHCREREEGRKIEESFVITEKFEKKKTSFDELDILGCARSFSSTKRDLWRTG